MKQANWFFLRGLVRESGHWAEFLPRFASAFPERKIITLDLPGTGARWREASPFTVAEMAARLRSDFLAQSSGNDYLFAVSLGAMVGMEWMERNPTDFRGSVLVNTSVKGISPFYRRLLPATYSTIVKLFAAGNALEKEKQILKITSNRRELHAETALSWAKIAEARPVSKKNAFRQLIAAARFSPPLKCPGENILLLNSRGDHLCAPSCSEDLARAWGLQIKTHPDAGHDLTLDDPSWVIEAIRAFS